MRLAASASSASNASPAPTTRTFEHTARRISRRPPVHRRRLLRCRRADRRPQRQAHLPAMVAGGKRTGAPLRHPARHAGQRFCRRRPRPAAGRSRKHPYAARRPADRTRPARHPRRRHRPRRRRAGLARRWLPGHRRRRRPHRLRAANWRAGRIVALAAGTEWPGDDRRHRLRPRPGADLCLFWRSTAPRRQSPWGAAA